MTDNLALASLSIGGRDKLFTRGDTITNGVILEQIEPLRVVVSEAGVLRQINLKNLGKGGAEADQELVRIQGRQESAGFELSGVLGASPVSLEDGSLGFRLSNISPEIAGMADLQERDIVVNVNGVPVEDLLVNPSRWQQIIGQSNVPLILVRDGQQQEIYVNAESLAERIMPQLGAGMVQSE